jgi:diguanylate cyclase (GGDEF)-like protein
MTTNLTFTLLVVSEGTESVPNAPWGPFVCERCPSLDAAAQRLQAGAIDGLWLPLADEAAAQAVLHWPALTHAVLDAGVVVSMPAPTAALALQFLRKGVQDLLSGPGAPSDIGRALRLGIERKRMEQAARVAYATDLATGLPNHAQLLEHMSHLLALREREPAPMALLVVRVDGLATAIARLGTESANVLRRKVAVRLRAALRASDVVASIGVDSFAVMLAWIDEPAAGERVAAKLAHSLKRTYTVAGHPVALALSVGIAHWPEHGRDPDALLRRAVGQAAGQASAGRAGFANRVERGPAVAANDEGPPQD